ncbi:hypothetical protein V5799_003358 [Amblyomma americanum]|uniref:Uncharacterized protein n=1 Tax=Amblyomma americanum TaxID=6943 RepID=A0AAQ4D971_AMBAM
MLLHSFTECCKRCCMYTTSFQSCIHAIYTYCHRELRSCHIDGKEWYCAFFFLSAPFVHSGRNISVLPDQNYCRYLTKKKVHTSPCVGFEKKSTKFIVCLISFMLIYGKRRRNVKIKLSTNA